MSLLYLILHLVLIYTSCVDLLETLVYNVGEESLATSYPTLSPIRNQSDGESMAKGTVSIDDV